MPSKEEIARRKKLVGSVVAQKRAAEEATMPISKADLKSLFNFLDQTIGVSACDHSLRHTRSFLVAHHLPEAAVVPWLGEHGGYCDCEVLANVEDHWGE